MPIYDCGARDCDDCDKTFRQRKVTESHLTHPPHLPGVHFMLKNSPYLDRPLRTLKQAQADIANDRPAFWQRYWRGVLRPRADRLGGRKNVVLNILNAAPKSALDP